jgi:hypothetical protein
MLKVSLLICSHRFIELVDEKERAKYKIIEPYYMGELFPDAFARLVVFRPRLAYNSIILYCLVILV